GGYLAQIFCEMHGSLISKLLLSNTFITTKLYSQKYKRILMIERLIPTFVLKKVMKKGLASIKHKSTREYLIDQLYNELTKKILITRLKSFITDEKLKRLMIHSFQKNCRKI
ncbi:MAG: hypothetical protein ACW97X_14415, partial [Candidatus Hodarchaeales archaeon]